MTNLLVIREQLKKFYGDYEVYITPALKFLLALLSFILINSKMGYMSKIDNTAIVLVLALMCSFLPINLIIVLAAVLILLHLYAASIECAVVAAAIFLLLFLLYFRFSPKDTLTVVLTPVCFALKIPYVIPLSMGLVGTPASAVSVGCGVIVYYMLNYINSSIPSLAAMDADGAVQKFRYIVDGVLNNKAMMVTIAAFAITIVAVYVVRRLSIDHSWTIAMVSGCILNILCMLFGDLMFNTNISIGGVILGSIVSVAIAKVLQFFVFNVDYTRTEFVQFEDDEYYYYVKAVPKNTVTAPEKKVKTIKVPEKAVNRNHNTNKF